MTEKTRRPVTDVSGVKPHIIVENGVLGSERGGTGPSLFVESAYSSVHKMVIPYTCVWSGESGDIPPAAQPKQCLRRETRRRALNQR